MSAKPAPNDPSVIKPGVRVVRRQKPGSQRSTWGIEVRAGGLWLPLRRPSAAARSGFVHAWWLTRAGAVEAAEKLLPGDLVRRFEVWREPHPTVDLVERLSLRTVEVADSDGPREAAVEYAHERELLSEAVVHVREVLHDGTALDGGAWRVEPVTTYRARPA